MADGDQVALADEGIGLAEADVAVHQLRRVHDREQRTPVGLDLGPLVRVLGILDREVVQVELLLQLVEQRVVGFVQADPDEAAVVDRQHIADLVQARCRVAVPPPVQRAVDDAGGLAACGAGAFHGCIVPAPPGGRASRPRASG